MVPLLSAVNQTNWKIGVTTTDPRRRCLVDLISRDDHNAQEKFVKAIRAGTNGTGNERGVLMAAKGLTDNCQNDWPREGSTLAILMLADEDNCSDNSADCLDDPNASPDYLYNVLQNDLNRQLGRDARVYGIFWHPDTEMLRCLKRLLSLK